jgi:sulfur relay (sulfurtransferase) complex TusBCD TusD component (DsrE family)
VTREERDEFLKILHAHGQTIEICEACAATTRDLATEIQRGGVPKKDDLQRTVEEAEKVLADLTSIREEVRRLLIAFS